MEPCIDCGMDTAPNDDRRRRGARTSERYMVRDSVWLAAGMPKREPMEYNKSPGDFLCIGCLEARLGRTLTPRDFIDAPISPETAGTVRALTLAWSEGAESRFPDEQR